MSKKTPANQAGYSYKMINKVKLQNQSQTKPIQVTPKLIYFDKVYQLSQCDDRFLKNMQDWFVRGKQIQIDKNIDWMLKDHRDFRYKIIKLIIQISKKNSNKNQQSNFNRQQNLFVKKGNLLQYLFHSLIQELKTLKFDNTIRFLESREIKQYCDTKFLDQVQRYTLQLKELQNFGHVFDQMKNKSEVRKFQLQTYKNILDNLNDHQKLVNIVSEYKKNKSLDKMTLQTLQKFTSKLDYQHRNESKQKTSDSKWLKHFLAIINSRFQKQEIFALQSSVNEQPNNIQLNNIMKTLKTFCLRNNEQEQFKEKLSKMTIGKPKTVQDTYFTFNNTKQPHLRSKFKEMFTKQLAIQLIQNNKQKQSNIKQSYILYICNKYLQKMNQQGYGVSKVQNFAQSKLPLIKQKLLELQHIIGCKQKQSSSFKKITAVQDQDFLYEVQASIQRMTIFLKTQNQIFNNKQSQFKKSQVTQSSPNLKSSQQSNRNQNSQTVNISLEDIKQIADLKNKIQNALELLGRSATLNRGNYYTVNPSQFDNNLKLISQNVKRIQQIIKGNQNKNLKQKSPTFMRATQPIKLQVRKNESLISNNLNSTSSQIKQLKQQLSFQKIYAQNNLKDITKLKSQLDQMKKTNQNLQINSTQLKRLFNQSQNKVKGLHNQCNSKDIQIIDLKQFNTKISKDFNLLYQQVQYYRKKQEQKNQNQAHLQTIFNQLDAELRSRISQNEGLTNKINRLNAEINQKNNIILLKESQIRALKNKQKQFDSKITKYEAIIVEKDQKLQKNTNELNEKETQIKDLLNKNQNMFANNKTEVIPEVRIKQPQQQMKISIPQRRSGNFRSFNTKQKSTAKNGVSTNKVPKSPSKNSQIKTNSSTVCNIKQSNLLPIIQKINHQSQKKQNDKKQKLKFQPKVLNYGFTAKLKDEKKQLQGLEIKIDNPMRTQDKKIDQSPKVDNKLTRAVSLKQKTQQQWIKQLKQKESKIESQKEQIRKLASIIQQLNKKIEEISKQNSSNKKEVEDLLKSNQKLREQQRKSLQLQVQFKKNKENQKNIIQDKKSDQPESHELKKLQQNFNEKCNQISQMQTTIKNLSTQVTQLQNDKLKLQKTIQSLKIQQKETVQKNVEKSKIKIVTTTQNNQEKQIISSLQAQKKEMKIKILSLELDIDQKQQHYQELREKYKKQTTALKNQIQSLTSVTPGFQSEIGTLKCEIQKRQQVLKSKQKEVQNLHAKIVQLQAEKQNEDIKRFEEQLKDLKKENESMERQVTRLCNERDKLESENNNLIDKSKNEKRLHKEEIQKMKKDQALQIKNLRLENARQVQEVRRQIKLAQYSQRVKPNTQKSGESNILLKMQHEKLKKDIELLQKSNTEKQQMIKNMNNQIASLNKTVQDKDNQIKRLQSQLRFTNSSMKQLESKLTPIKGGIKQISTIIFDRFFQNQALYQQLYKKYLLYDLIQLQTKKNIKSTSLLYRLDKLNKVNFHEYVDGKNNVVAIIKTSNGNVFGGFSTSKLQKGYKQPTGTVSFIFTFDSPTTIEHFNLDEKKNLKLRSFDWDEYFFVFGNAEIRWRFGERKIYSNFAINNGYYETKGRDVSALLKQGNSRETAIVALDFYQVQFEK